MSKKHWYCASLKICVFTMALVNFMWGVLTFVSGTGYINFLNPKMNQELDDTLFLVFLPVLGFIFIFNAFLLLYGTMKVKEICIFLYIILGSTSLFIVTVICAIGFSDKKVFICIFAVLWYGQFCVYNFYKQMVKYHLSVDSSENIEIDSNSNSNINSELTKEESLETTTV